MSNNNNNNNNSNNNLNIRIEFYKILKTVSDYSTKIPELASFIKHIVRKYDAELLQTHGPYDYHAMQCAIERLDTYEHYFGFITQSTDTDRRKHAIKVTISRFQIPTTK
jgi:hypothetical protein